jgi:hypothetical protein
MSSVIRHCKNINESKQTGNLYLNLSLCSWLRRFKAANKNIDIHVTFRNIKLNPEVDGNPFCKRVSEENFICVSYSAIWTANINLCSSIYCIYHIYNHIIRLFDCKVLICYDYIESVGVVHVCLSAGSTPELPKESPRNLAVRLPLTNAVLVLTTYDWYVARISDGRNHENEIICEIWSYHFMLMKFKTCRMLWHTEGWMFTGVVVKLAASVFTVLEARSSDTSANYLPIDTT